LLNALAKTINACRIYPPTSTIRDRSLTEFFERFVAFNESHGPLRLYVRPGQLFYRGQEVYQSEDRADVLAVPLFRDGIRILSLLPGCSREELDRLIQVLSQGSEPNQTDDLATLLWDQDFLFIKYLVADDFLEFDQSTANEDLARLENGEILPFGLKTPTAKADSETADTPSDSAQTEAAVATGPPDLPDVVALDSASRELTDSEIDRLQEEISGADATTLPAVAEVLFNILGLAESEGNEEAEAIERLMMVCIKRRQLELLADIARRLRLLAGELEQETPVKAARVLRSLATIQSAPPLIATLCELFEQTGEQSFPAIQHVLQEIHGDEIPALCRILAKLETLKSRRTFCDQMALAVANRPEALAAQADGALWYVDRNIAYILGNIGSSKVVNHLEVLLGHSDFRVRREAIRALGKIVAPSVPFTLLNLVRNSRERMDRLVAAWSLRDLMTQAAFKSLLLLVQTREFTNRDPEEQKEIFLTLAAFRHDAAAEEIAGLVRKRQSLFRRPNDTLKRGLLRTLFAMNIPSSQAALEALRRSGGKRLVRLIAELAEEEGCRV